MTTAAAEQKLTARIASMSDDMLLACVVQIGNPDNITTEERMVRTRMLAEYERRQGGEAVDLLMDMLGL